MRFAGDGAEQCHRSARQRQLQSQVAEARALQRGVEAAAPARSHQRAAPPGLQHRARPPPGVPRLQRQAAQKIRRRPTRKKQNWKPQRNHSNYGEIGEEHIFDRAIAATVRTTAARFAQVPCPKSATAANPTRTRSAVTLLGVQCMNGESSVLEGAIKRPETNALNT